MYGRVRRIVKSSFGRLRLTLYAIRGREVLTGYQRRKMNIIANKPTFRFLYILCFLVSTCSGYPLEKRWKRDITTPAGTEDVPRVFLTVSSLASRSREPERLLELNWHGAPVGLNEEDGSRIALFDQNPDDDAGFPLVSVRPAHHPEGYYRTSVQFPRQTFVRENMTDACLGFWIAYLHNDEVLSWNCVRARPNWMSDMASVIGRVPLPDLMIPGTHNAGSYATFEPGEDSVLKRYLITQDESIWNQLVYGVRYLDLRVAYQSSSTSEDHLWITHGHFRTEIPVRRVIEQVKAFLNSTREVVIMDFHRFVNGFNGRRAVPRHRELIEMLERELGDYMIPVALSSWATLNELWQMDKRLYVGYASNRDRRQSQFLFPAIKHLWGDVDRVDQLHDYLNGTVCSRRNSQRLTSAMVQLTPTTSGAIFDTYGGLRKMAHDVNRHATRWFRDDWADCANIVATDYFMGNNMIETAVEVNRNRFSSGAW